MVIIIIFIIVIIIIIIIVINIILIYTMRDKDFAICQYFVSIS